ncbi:hypothetical protein PHYC_02538 [Phycisphaerales bacterium]|nr:hypothetical protein PHYC_02538 [Phycisphaerales bacterium]
MLPEPREPVLAPHPTPPFLRKRVHRFVAGIFALCVVQAGLLLAGAGSRPFLLTVVFAVVPGIAGCVYTTWFLLTWHRATARAKIPGELRCWECGYSLDGHGEAGTCPECGKTFDAHATRAMWRGYSRRGRDDRPPA